MRLGHHIYYLAVSKYPVSLPILASPSASSLNSSTTNADTTPTNQLSLPTSIINSSTMDASNVNYSALINGCFDPASLILHLIRPFFSFYQLFILFKYSNLIINKNRKIASFALMHLIGTSINFWFGTIVDDAIDFYISHHYTPLDNFQATNDLNGPVETSTSSSIIYDEPFSLPDFNESEPVKKDDKIPIRDKSHHESNMLVDESMINYVIDSSNKRISNFYFTNLTNALTRKASASKSFSHKDNPDSASTSDTGNSFNLPVNLIKINTYTYQLPVMKSSENSLYTDAQGANLHLTSAQTVNKQQKQAPPLIQMPLQMIINSTLESGIIQNVNDTLTSSIRDKSTNDIDKDGNKGRDERSQVTFDMTDQLFKRKGRPAQTLGQTLAQASAPFGLRQKVKRQAHFSHSHLITDATATSDLFEIITSSSLIVATTTEGNLSDEDFPSPALVETAPATTTTTTTSSTGTNETFASPPLGTPSMAISLKCTSILPFVLTSSKIFPYMYPFSIEFYLCLAFFWFILWSHIGHESTGHDLVKGNSQSNKSIGLNCTKDRIVSPSSIEDTFESPYNGQGRIRRLSSSYYYSPFNQGRSRSYSNGTNWSFQSSRSNVPLSNWTSNVGQMKCHSSKVVSSGTEMRKSSFNLHTTSLGNSEVTKRFANNYSSHSLQSSDTVDTYQGPPLYTRSQSDVNNDISHSGLTSSVVITADCHSASKGLFAGFFVLILSLVLLILFFFTINSSSVEAESSAPLNENQIIIALYIFHIQELILTSILFFGTIYCYFIFTTKLTLKSHIGASTSCQNNGSKNIGSRKSDSRLDSIHLKIDSTLLILPIPFYLFSTVLSVSSELALGPNWVRIFLLALTTFSIVLQSIFIIDAFDRRLTNRLILTNRKPGREIVTLLIITNLTSWIVYTFEFKAVETLFFTTETNYYGSTTAFVLSHATLPLMLFYKFHASVCLAEIWKNSYSNYKQVTSRKSDTV